MSKDSDGARLSEDEWIELMNKYDDLEQYAKQRQDAEQGEQNND